MKTSMEKRVDEVSNKNKWEKGKKELDNKEEKDGK